MQNIAIYKKCEYVNRQKIFIFIFYNLASRHTERQEKKPKKVDAD